MCELLAVSSRFPTRVTFSLEEFSRHGGQSGPHADGWGVAFYEGRAVQIYREIEPAAQSEWMHFLCQHQHQSKCVISHIRKATHGELALRNTQPFSRKIGGATHVFCHNGDLEDIRASLGETRILPIGETDSEYAFCYLVEQLEKLWQQGTPALAARVALLRQVFDRFAGMGPANILYSDSEYLYAYANRRTQSSGRVEPPGMYYLCRDCECDKEALPLAGLELNALVKDQRQTVVLFASVPLSPEPWKPLAENQLIVASEGRIVSLSGPSTQPFPVNPHDFQQQEEK